MDPFDFKVSATELDPTYNEGIRPSMRSIDPLELEPQVPYRQPMQERPQQMTGASPPMKWSMFADAHGFKAANKLERHAIARQYANTVVPRIAQIRGKSAEEARAAFAATVPEYSYEPSEFEVRLAQAKEAGRDDETAKIYALTGKLPGAADSGDEFGLNPVWVQNSNGEMQLYQPSKSGGAPRLMQFPTGFAPAPQTRSLDLGTGYQTVPTRGVPVQVGQVIQKDLAGAEAEKAIGGIRGAAQGSLGAAEINLNNAINKVDSILTDPSLAQVTGSIQGNLPEWATSVFNGGSTGDVLAKIDELQGTAFLQAFESLKGGGPITDIEGRKATDAISRLSHFTQSDDGYKAALNDLKDAFKSGLEKLKAKAGPIENVQGSPSPVPAEKRTKSGLTWSLE